MAKTRNPKEKPTKENEKKNKKKPQSPHSWAAVRSLFTCKYLQVQPPKHDVQPLVALNQKPIKKSKTLEEMNKNSKKLKRCSGSLCSNTKVMQKPESNYPSQIKRRSVLMVCSSNTTTTVSSNRRPLTDAGVSNASASPLSGSLRNIPFRKLTGCYECKMVVDPVLGMSRDLNISSCSKCGQIFTKPHHLDLHLAVTHAVSELGAEDTSKNIVEIIFQSSWLKKEGPVCKIDRILKVHNSPRTVSRFEEYRESIKAKANKKQPRCLADGNELLRFHCTTLVCSLGLNGTSHLCNSIPTCTVCAIIKNGFNFAPHLSSKGILTTATSGRAHDRCTVEMEDGKRAMLVCRVIAGRVNKNPDGNLEDYDSVGGGSEVYSNLDELYVFNPKAVLPCFVVIYGGF